MIDDVDLALTSLLRARLPEGTEVTVGPPPEPGTSAGGSVSLLLHSVAEDNTRRADEPEPVRGPQGRTVARQRPPRRFHLSYLVSVTGPDVAAEHRLLSQTLAVLAAHNQMPAEFVTGGLAQNDVPVIMDLWPTRTVASIEPASDIWASIGRPLRPSIDLRITSPLLPMVVEEVGPPIVERVIEVESTGTGSREALREPAELVARRRAMLIEGAAPAPPPRRARRS